MKRDNLDVISFARVNKINFDRNKRAVSVSYTRDGSDHLVRVCREVILSAGAIDSPKILMLSGVGNEEELANLDITPISNLPQVGQQFQDHPNIFPLMLTTNEPIKGLTYDDLKTYQAREEGLLTKNPDLVIGFLTDEQASIDSNDSKVQVSFGVTFGGQIGLEVTLNKPRSRGSIKLKSNNPNDDPLIDRNFFSDEYDIQYYRRAIKKVTALITNSPYLRRLNVSIQSRDVAGCGKLNSVSLMDDVFLDCLIRMDTTSALHMVQLFLELLYPHEDKTKGTIYRSVQ